MNKFIRGFTCLSVCLALFHSQASAAESPRDSKPPGTSLDAQMPRVPRFSIEYMDKSVEPGADFYHYADGNWLKNNPVPPDKSRWGGFAELQERNWFLIH